MKKFIGFIIITIISLFIAVIPELVMLMIWNLVDPVGFVQKAVMIAIFSLGIGLCVLFGFLGLALWGAMVQAIL